MAEAKGKGTEKSTALNDAGNKIRELALKGGSPPKKRKNMNKSRGSIDLTIGEDLVMMQEEEKYRSL